MRPARPTNTFDAGAIKLDNPASTPLVVDSISVDIGPVTGVNLWPKFLPLTIPPHQSAIFTQTNDLFDFDTSEFPNTTCTPDGFIPLIHVTVGTTQQQTKNYIDTTQIINTGGFDVGSCPPTKNEGHEWTVVNENKCPCEGHQGENKGNNGNNGNNGDD